MSRELEFKMIIKIFHGPVGVFAIASLMNGICALRLIGALGNATVEGHEPLGSPLATATMMIILSGIAGTAILYLARRLKFQQFLFTVCCAGTAIYIFYVLNGGMDCQYWHQGDVFCSRMGTPVILFALCHVVFCILCIFAISSRILMRQRVDWYKVIFGGILFVFDLLFFAIAFVGS